MSNEHYLKAELYELLRSGHSVFDFLQQGSLDGVWYWDLQDTDHEWMSPEFWRLMGYDPDEMPHSPSAWQDLIHPDDLQTALANFQGHAADPSVPYDQVVRYRHRDGQTVWVRCRGLAIRDDDGTPTRMLGVHVDLTEQMQARDELQTRNGQLIAAERLGGMGHWVFSVANGQMSWSPHLFQLYERDASAGSPDLSDMVAYCHADDRARVQRALDTLATDGGTASFDFCIVVDAGHKHMTCRVRSEQGRDGRVQTLFGVVQDVTERRVLEERVRRSEKLASIGTLSASVAHEINNPLSYVMLNTQFLSQQLEGLEGVPGDDRAELLAMLDDVNDGVQRIKRIVSGLMGFAKTRERTIGRVELGQVVRSALRLLQNELVHLGAVHVSEPEGPLAVEGDEGQLVQLVLNLLQNAVHAMKRGGSLQVEVQVRRAGDRCELSVRDHGVGMAPGVLAQAMEPFFTTKAADVGTGLGMFVSRGIAEGHGGTLTLSSVEGEWTQATLSLPEAREPSPPLPAKAAAPERDGRARVLLIDDQPRVARSIARAMRPHRVDVVTDPEEAVRRLNDPHQAYDVVFCDLMMPGLRGEDVYAAAPVSMHHRFYFLTGGAFTPGSEDFASAMRHRVVEKPPQPQQLHDAIRQVLQAYDTPE